MKKSRAEKNFEIFNVILMILLCVVTLYPYLNQLAISFNDGNDTMRGGLTIFPRVFTLENYTAIFSNDSVWNAAAISVLRVVMQTVLSVAVVYLAAYALTRKGLPYRKGLTVFLMIPAYISAGTIPIYITYRYYHLINNFLVYVVPGLFSFYNMVIIRSFLQDLPASLEEAAKVDGANDFLIMYKIIFPLSLPVIATVALWVAVGAWNDWTTTLMYITNDSLYTIQYIMMRLIKESGIAQQLAQEAAMTGKTFVARTTSESVKAATLIFTTVPIILVYPFLQKYFMKGVTLGAVKE